MTKALNGRNYTRSCICSSAYTHIRINIHVYEIKTLNDGICASVFICASMCTCICMYLSACTCMYMHERAHAYAYVYVLI